MSQVAFSLLFIFLLPFQSIAGEIAFLDRQALNIICKQEKLSLSNINQSNSLEICQAIIKSDFCKEFPERNLRNCRADALGYDDSGWVQNIGGCLEGVLTSVQDIYNLVKSMLLFVKDYAVDGEKRNEINEKTLLKMDNYLNYYELEVERIAKQLDGPLKETRASLIVAKNLLIKFISDIIQSIKTEYVEFACLNEAGIVERSCKMLANVVLPPAVLFTAILKGKPFLMKLLSKKKWGEFKRDFDVKYNKKVKDQVNADYEQEFALYRKEWDKARRASFTEKFEKDKADVAELYSQHKYKEAAKLNYERNMDRLLDEFPENERAAIKADLEKRYELRDGEDIVATSIATADRSIDKIIIQLHKKFHGTEIEYLFKTHESHHFLMNVKRAKTGTPLTAGDLRTQKRVEDLTKLRYLSEAGAMSQEWQFLAHIPKRDREWLIRDLKKNSKFSDEEIKAFESILKSGDANNASGFVRQEAKRNRYDRKQMIQEAKDEQFNIENPIISKKATFAISSGLIAFPLITYCVDLKNRKQFDTHVYQSICTKIPGISDYFEQAQKK